MSTWKYLILFPLHSVTPRHRVTVSRGHSHRDTISRAGARSPENVLQRTFSRAGARTLYARRERYGIWVKDNFCLKDERLSHSCHAHVTPKPIWVRDTSCFAYEKTHAQEGRGGVMVPMETLMVLKKIRSELWPNRVGNWPNLSCYHRVSIIRFLRTECTLAYTLRVCTALHPCSWCVWVTCPRRVR